MAPHNPLRSFEALPFDIHFELFRYLDFEYALNFASTNRYFHQALNPRTSLPKDEVRRFVTRRDQSDQNRDKNIFACYKCFRFLPRHKFSRKATSRGTGKKGKPNPDRTERTCFDCAAKHRLYDHLRPISNGKLLYYFCHNCGNYKTKSSKCNTPRLDIDPEAAEVLALCGLQPTKTRSTLESLPVHITRIIVSFLGFSDAIQLAASCKVLQDIIQPVEWVPIHIRYRFVRDLWHMNTFDIEHDSIESFPCYMCCQILPKRKFTEIQLKKAGKYPETSWKMRCQACIQKMYNTKMNSMRRDHQRRRMCEICKCVRLGGKTCGGCMELYVKGAIDRGTMYPVKLMSRDDFDYGDLINSYDGMFE